MQEGDLGVRQLSVRRLELGEVAKLENNYKDGYNLGLDNIMGLAGSTNAQRR